VHARGVQAVVEEALGKVADHPIEVVAAGRTDAGVHASMQVVHFDTEAIRTPRSWVLGANTHLPSQVSALWAREVAPGFHARFGAIARRYRYFILNRGPRPAIASKYVSWVRYELDHEVMQAAARHLIGQHDFSSFRAAECQARTPIRHMHAIEVTRHDEIITIDVMANAFLHHMVRNIAGVLITVGKGDRPPTWAAEVLAAKDRKLGGVTAPAEGLYLTGVRYAAAFALPSEPAAPSVVR
jgi:tRNA pseudouridine38-40 synthase